jgi:hypothetical protein
VNDSRGHTPTRLVTSASGKKINSLGSKQDVALASMGTEALQKNTQDVNLSPFNVKNIGHSTEQSNIDSRKERLGNVFHGESFGSKTDTKTDNSLSFKQLDIQKKLFILSDTDKIPRRIDISPPIRIDGRVDKSKRASFDQGSLNHHTTTSSVLSNISVPRKNMFYTT